MTVGIPDTFSPFLTRGFRLFLSISAIWEDGMGIALLFGWGSVNLGKVRRHQMQKHESLNRYSVIGIIILALIFLAAPAFADLYGWDYGGGGLISVDTLTGSSSLVIPSTRKIESLAFDSSTRTLYGIENEDVSTLIEIDVGNGTVADIGIIAGYDEITGMTYDAQTDTIFALDQGTREFLIVDPLNAAATLFEGYGFYAGNAMAAHPTTWDIYAGAGVDPSYLVSVDMISRASSLIGSTGTNSLRALAFDPLTEILYGNVGLYNAGGSYATIDLATGIAYPFGPETRQITALAFAPAPIPNPPPSSSSAPACLALSG
jgi:hypothetical protein